MYWIDEEAQTHGAGRQVSFICDSSSDLAHLPTSSTPGQQQGEDTVSCLPCAKGSSCICIATSSMYMLNSNDQWIEM